MYIQEIKQRKENVENEIKNLLNNFKKDTSLDVSDININSLWQYPEGFIIYQVKLNIKI